MAGCQPNATSETEPNSNATEQSVSERFAAALLDRDFVTAYDLTTKNEETIGSPQTLVARTDVMYARTKLPDGKPWRPTRFESPESQAMPEAEELSRRFALPLTSDGVQGMKYEVIPFKGDDDPSGFIPPILHLLLKDEEVAYFAFETPRHLR